MGEFLEKVQCLKESLLESTNNLILIILFLIVLNLVFMAVWIYGLVSALNIKST